MEKAGCCLYDALHSKDFYQNIETYILTKEHAWKSSHFQVR